MTYPLKHLVLSPKTALQLVQQRVYILRHLTVWQFPVLIMMQPTGIFLDSH